MSNCPKDFKNNKSANQISSLYHYNIVEKHQPYNNPTIKLFNELCNDNKHRKLTPQTYVENKNIKVERDGGYITYNPNQVSKGTVCINGTVIMSNGKLFDDLESNGF